MMTTALSLMLAVTTANGSKATMLDFHNWAKTPPMGWNSWDCFGIGVNEQLTRENATYMAEKLKKYGYTVVTVDIDWFVPGAKGWNYTPNVEIAMDGYGRPLPAVDRFPSAANGKGFKALADWTHSKGLKFGVHILRGIPRKAVEKNLPIFGTNVRAADIADKNSICPWNPDMYGVDMSKPGAQAWYDSMIGLLAEWGVDFVKVDDLSRPYHLPEIEAIRKAIDKSKRPIVFSTSPGETPVASGAHVQDHANMWRVSDDFWDSWPALKEQFARLNAWTPHRGPGHWPDADMLPLGAVRQGQRNDWTNFTYDEQVTLMSLWSIARSPLILGGHLPKTDDRTLALITNPEVLKVNQTSTNNRQLWRKGDLVAWVADAPGSKDKYLALFNADERLRFEPSRAAYQSGVIGRSTLGKDVTLDIPVSGAKKLWLVVDDAGDGYNADQAVWALPEFDGRPVERFLTATQGYGETQVDKNVIGQPLTLNGKRVKGFGTHANSTITVDVPAGSQRFTATIGLEREGASLNGGGTLRFYVFTKDPMVGSEKLTAPVSIDLAELSFVKGAKVRNLWQRKDLGVVTGTHTAEVPFHGAVLYKLTPASGSK